jgi:microfibrillar-associated protein 1
MRADDDNDDVDDDHNNKNDNKERDEKVKQGRIENKIVPTGNAFIGAKVKSKQQIQTQNDDSTTSSSDSDSDSSSSDSSSSSSSSDDDPDPSILNISSSKPIFVPKHKRNNILTQNQKQLQQEQLKEEQEKIRIEKRIQSSRALVAEVVANEKKENESLLHGNNDGEDEFQESGGYGSSMMKPPSDQDWTNDKEQMEQRDIWEVRELMRLLREYEENIMIQQDAKERERRRNMTDEERYYEDVKSGKYRKPGEQRRQPKDGGKEDGVYLQRYYHRGAFYMDEDTLNQDSNDIRHRAAEYASAATGDDKVNRKAMPKVMQVKKFGFANQHKYKGLAMEDTTDKSMDYLPLNKSNKRPKQMG